MNSDDWRPTDSIVPKNMPDSVKRQLQVLRHVKRLLREQVDKDKDTLSELLEKKARVEKGGGK